MKKQGQEVKLQVHLYLSYFKDSLKGTTKYDYKYIYAKN